MSKSIYDSLQCLWMSSGMVTYRLCDKKFNCENCLFDKVMRNQKIELKELSTYEKPQGIINDKLEALEELTFSPNYIYLKNNLILKNLFGNTYYMGISPLASTILDCTTGFNYCKDGVPVQTNFPILQFHGEWGSLKVAAPLNFYCLGRLKQEINSENINDWFLLVEIYPSEIESSILTESEYIEEIHSTKEILSTVYGEFHQSVGVTMNDGGVFVQNLSHALDNRQYYKLLKALFSHK